MNVCVGKRCNPFGPEIERHFYPHHEKDGVTLKLAEENASEIEKELCLAGYFAIVSSDKMTAREAICLYKSRSGTGIPFLCNRSSKRSMRRNNLLISASILWNVSGHLPPQLWLRAFLNEFFL